MGVEGVDSMSQEEYRKAAIDAVKKLSQDVGIPIIERAQRMRHGMYNSKPHIGKSHACHILTQRHVLSAFRSPADLKEIVKKEDIAFLAQSAYDDACRPGNPKETSVEDLTSLYESLI